MANTAEETIRKFFELFECYQEVEDKLNELLLIAMSSSQVDDWTGDQRADTIFYVKQISDFLRASFTLKKDLSPPL